MKSGTLLSVLVAALLVTTMLVWLSVMVVDVDQWYFSAIDQGGVPGYPRVMPMAQDSDTITGGAK